jgi:lipopolysaccharide/colanic/teichoic acid biosynthesis glycosyltransferase
LEYIPFYNTEQSRRHEVLPGITGWAQINGRNAISWEEKFQLDVWYVDNRSMRLDLYILYRTFLKALRPEGINAASDTTMPRFDKQERKS